MKKNSFLGIKWSSFSCTIVTKKFLSIQGDPDAEVVLRELDPQSKILCGISQTWIRLNPVRSDTIRKETKWIRSDIRDVIDIDIEYSWRHWYRYRILVTSLRSLFCIEGRRWKIYEERRRKKLKFNFRLKEAFWDEKMSLWEIIPIDIILLLRAVSWKN